MGVWRITKLYTKECAVGKVLFAIILLTSLILDFSWGLHLLTWPADQNWLDVPTGAVVTYDKEHPTPALMTWHKVPVWKRVTFLSLWPCQAQTYGRYYPPNGDWFDDNEIHRVDVPKSKTLLGWLFGTNPDSVEPLGARFGHDREITIPARVFTQKGKWYWEARVYGSCAPWEFLGRWFQISDMNIKMTFTVK